MKKKLAQFIFIIVLCACFFTACDKGGENRSEPEITTADWMRGLKSDARLTDVVLPGSHDAGTADMILFSETQSDGVGIQLESGVRYLDLRVKYDSQNVPVIYHGSITGATFSSVADEIAAFIAAHPSEFLVLDFQHFEGGAQAAARAIIEEKLNPSGYAVKTSEQISGLTVGKAREKGYRYIVVWGRSEPEENCDYIFPRSESLISPYTQDNHYKGWDYLFDTVFNDYYAMRDGNKFFVLQTVLTTSINSSDETFLQSPEYTAAQLDKLWTQFETSLDLNATNVVMRDFITKDKTFLNNIIRLNQKKGLTA